MRDHILTYFLADTRKIREYPRRQVNTTKDFHKLSCNDWRLFSRFHNDSVARDYCCCSHASQNCQWEVPRRNHDCDSSGLIVVLVNLPREIVKLTRRRKP